METDVNFELCDLLYTNDILKYVYKKYYIDFFDEKIISFKNEEWKRFDLDITKEIYDYNNEQKQELFNFLKNINMENNLNSLPTVDNTVEFEKISYRSEWREKYGLITEYWQNGEVEEINN